MQCIFKSDSVGFCGGSGTVIDSAVCHPKNNDFYMCAQAGMIVSTTSLLNNQS